MFYTCKRCRRQFEYNDERGYSREFCGPICDGDDSGRRVVIRTIQQLAEQLRVKGGENVGTDAELAFEAAASSIERVCDELME